MEFKKNSVIPVEIVELAYGGLGLGRVDGMVVFVEGALPGDLVQARIQKKAARHAHAVIERIDRPSDRRIPAPCPIFDHCGGCTWQNLRYEDQLHWKRRQVAETIAHIGGQQAPEPLPMIASPVEWNYRNKMEYSFGLGEGAGAIVGFHTPGRFDQIFEVASCMIHPRPFDGLLAGLTRFARANKLPGYDQRTHRGFLRHAVMRHSRTTGGVVLVLITNDGTLPRPAALVEELRAACPELQGFIWGTNRGVADVAIVEQTRFTWGDTILRETINGLTFAISPQSFFQTNTAAGEKLYALVAEMAELTGADRVLDAYCGAGSIGLHCAARAGRVAGIEVIRQAIWDARANAAANGITNSTFIAAPVNEGLKLARAAAGGDFTRVIIDPPRGGMDKKSLAGLIQLRAPVFLYVSCNPATLSRDLQTLGEGGYTIDAVQPLDMFPHTHHIETIVRLRLTARPRWEKKEGAAS